MNQGWLPSENDYYHRAADAVARKQNDPMSGGILEGQRRLKAEKDLGHMLIRLGVVIDVLDSIIQAEPGQQ